MFENGNYGEPWMAMAWDGTTSCEANPPKPTINLKLINLQSRAHLAAKRTAVKTSLALALALALARGGGKRGERKRRTGERCEPEDKRSDKTKEARKLLCELFLSGLGKTIREVGTKDLQQKEPYKASGNERLKKCMTLVESQETCIMSKESKQGEVLLDHDLNKTRMDGQHTGTSIGCTLPITGKDANEPDWEDGTISTTHLKDVQLDPCGNVMTIELSESPSLAQRRTVRRASSEDKILAELVHKVHLLCFLARGRLVDKACSDPLIQASLLSLLPLGLLQIAEAPKLTVKNLVPLLNWFHMNFQVQSSCVNEGDFKSSLSFALGTRKGTAEEVVALSVSLFRALNLSARFVSILDVVSLKPDAVLPGCSNQDVQDIPRLDTRISSSSAKVTMSLSEASTSSPADSSSRKSSHAEISNKSAQRGKQKTKICKQACNNEQLNSSSVTTVSNNEILDTSNHKSCDRNLDVPSVDHLRKSKRKGDVEFELQLEMAVSATGAGLDGSDLSTKMKDTSPLFDRPSSLKKLKKTQGRESTLPTEGSDGTVWSRKTGPPLYWAEVYCSGEALTGRWVHVDAANGIIDGEQQIESAFAACRKLLKYVVAFAGSGAKDWYKIASQRINSSWWDAVLAPLKQLESSATGGVVCSEVHREGGSPEKWKEPMELSSTGNIPSAESSKVHAECLNLADGFQREMTKEHGSKVCLHFACESHGAITRESLEDMELETRALTESLPTIQLAYKNHHLYVIERWLTKFQVLHPKGPVLGYCSGHPVYPRACVQMVQTKRKWLQEGMQVKVNEVPSKVVKQSQKLGRRYASEPTASEEDDSKPVIELFGKWQVEPLCLPPAVDGIVPKNERGQVEVWSEKCLPPGTTHLRLPRLAPVAKRLEVDFAPAMIGFEFRNGRSYPIFEGIVVCSEFKDAILEAYAEEEERREAEERKRSEAQALSRWYQLLCSIITRQRLKNAYEHVPHRPPAKEPVNGSGSAPSISHEVTMELGEQQKASAEAPRQDSLPGGDHEHIFPIEYQSFDTESSVRTKRCPCGFSIEMEEL
ncbi:hypothetical protein Taro_027810 [Colocasia esculenta]|uniref:DNA repair protein RAD4 n=1 Tax=Colocasia esculenta TaxID=4460 RepID=A0A843VSH0_COLES|nr:hypothetical protein [Colocasia esculenta]